MHQHTSALYSPFSQNLHFTFYYLLPPVESTTECEIKLKKLLRMTLLFILTRESREEFWLEFFLIRWKTSFVYCESGHPIGLIWILLHSNQFFGDSALAIKNVENTWRIFSQQRTSEARSPSVTMNGGVSVKIPFNNRNTSRFLVFNQFLLDICLKSTLLSYRPGILFTKTSRNI